MGVDTLLWITSKIGSEALEIFLQINVLFGYGGTTLFLVYFNDDLSNEDVILAEILEYIRIFAIVILSFISIVRIQ